jgi:hypothetical protein
MREELHGRLENLTMDVEDVINAAEQQEEQGETFETDELYGYPSSLTATYSNS